MSCIGYRKRMGAYLDGELSEREQKSVEAHLTGCVACRAALSDLRALEPLLHVMEVPPIPAGIAAKVVAVAQTHRSEKATASWNPFQWWRMTTTPIHAAGIFVLVIGLITGLSIGGTMLPRNDQTASPQVSMQIDPLNLYNLDYLNDAPDSSLPGIYIALASRRGEERQ